MDTDGTVTASGSAQFAVTSNRLAEDVRELVVSLGWRCSWSTKRVMGRNEGRSTCYTLTFTPRTPVFRLRRKLAALKERSTGGTTRTTVRYIRDVRPVDCVPVRCIQVAAAGGLFLDGR